jgi:hypothetical protein
MGHRHSRPAPPIYPPNDPMFVQVGCTGLKQSDYLTPRLEAAPFLYFKILTNNYDDLFNTIINILKNINPANAGSMTGTSSTGSGGLFGMNFGLNTPNITVSSTTNPSDYSPATFNQQQRDALASGSAATYSAQMAAQSSQTAQAAQGSSQPQSYAKQQVQTQQMTTPVYNINNITDNSFVYGPIYLLTAYNADNKIIESYLYFPSMTKDMRPWNNYSTLGMNHSWMYRLLYNYQYRFTPYSSCNVRIGDRPNNSIINELKGLYSKNLLGSPDKLGDALIKGHYVGQLNKKRIHDAYVYGLAQGCVTQDFEKNACQQSDSVHRGMGIFRDGLNSNGYPAVYFTTYSINMKDYRVSSYINKNSFANLQRNVLIEETDIFPGCQYMLISPTQKYFMSIGNMSVIIYYNTMNVDLYEACFSKKSPQKIVPVSGKIFQDCTITRGIIESGNFNIYGTSDFDPDEIEQLLFTLFLTKDLSYPIAINLTDEGTLQVVNNSNKILNVIDIANGFKSANNTEYKGGKSIHRGVIDYNAKDDYRQRLINLIMYLQERGIYKEDPFYRDLINPAGTADTTHKSGLEADNSPASQMRQDIAAFNSHVNYLNRFDEFSQYLLAQANNNNDSYKMSIIENDVINYRPGGGPPPPYLQSKLALSKKSGTGAGTNSTPKQKTYDDIANDDNNTAFSSDISNLKEETPEERAKRLEDEDAARKKKKQDAQDAKGAAEDASYDENSKAIKPGSKMENGAIITTNGLNFKTRNLNDSKPKSVTPNVPSVSEARLEAEKKAQLYYASGKYNEDDDLNIRYMNLDDQYRAEYGNANANNPDQNKYVDYYDILSRDMTPSSTQKQFNTSESYNISANAQNTIPDYNYDKDLKARRLALNDYYKTSNPNFIDFYTIK